MSPRLVPAVLALSTVVFVAAPVRAQEPARAQEEAEPDAQQIAMARSLFEDGIAAAEAERWTAARDAFARSYELLPRVVTLFNLAGARRWTGQLLDAAESYRAFLREATDERYAPFRSQAEVALTELEARFARVTVRVEGLSEEDRAELDGRAFPRPALGTEVPMDPGAHVVEVLRGNVRVAIDHFEVAEGARADIALEVVPPPPAPVASTPPLPEVRVEPAASPSLVDVNSEEPSSGSTEDDNAVVWAVVVPVLAALIGAGVAVGVVLSEPTGFTPDALPEEVSWLGTFEHP